MGKQWFVIRGEKRFGPLSTAKLKEMASDGKIHDTDLIQSDTMKTAKPASQIAGLLHRMPERDNLIFNDADEDASFAGTMQRARVAHQSGASFRRIGTLFVIAVFGFAVFFGGIILIAALGPKTVDVRGINEFIGGTTDASDFADNTSRYKGKTVSLAMNWEGGRGTLRDEVASILEMYAVGGADFAAENPQRLKFSRVGPKVMLSVDVPNNPNIAVPNVRDLDQVTVTFKCGSGSLRHGNTLIAISR